MHEINNEYAYNTRQMIAQPEYVIALQSNQVNTGPNCN